MTDKPILFETPPGRMPNDEILLQSFIWPVMCAAINGLQLSLRQIPIQHIMIAACAMFGRCMGETISQGDLTSVFTLRKECIDAFNAGMKAAKIKTAPDGVHGMKQ